jgi:hypothetical protein
MTDNKELRVPDIVEVTMRGTVVEILSDGVLVEFSGENGATLFIQGFKREDVRKVWDSLEERWIVPIALSREEQEVANGLYGQ